MARHIERTIKGVDDFELGKKRGSPLKYFLTIPNKGEIRGLVFVIPGFGLDSNSEYSRKLRQFITDNYSLASVTVMYHATQSRPTNGGIMFFELQDFELLVSKLRYYACPISNLGPDSIMDHIYLLDQAVAKAKREKKMDINSLYKNQCEILTSGIHPQNGDYQNFGVMQALDHIFVLYDLMKNMDFNKGNIIAFGSSHGAYIANLMSKFAPNTISSVLDNSSYPEAHLSRVVGRDIGKSEHICYPSQNIVIFCFLKSGWTLDKDSQNYFSRDRQRIRSFLFDEDIKTMADTGRNKTQYRFYHSRHDHRIGKVKDKLKTVSLLKENGFDVQMSLMDKDDVDGVFVKNLDHGMDLSLKLMFEKLYKTVVPKNSHTDIDLNSEIIYKGFEMDYVFRYEKDIVVPEVIMR